MDYPGTTTDGLLDGFRLRVEQDENAGNPTEWGNHVVEGDDIHSQWARGDVYGVVMERYVLYIDPTGQFSDYGRWLETDSLWGCYLGSDYTALTVAREHGFEGVDYTELANT
jgi:hypothetical protein